MTCDSTQRRLLPVLGLLLCLGCKGEAAKQETPSATVSSKAEPASLTAAPSASAVPTAAAAAAAPSASAAPATGLDAPGLDSKVVAGFRGVMEKCKWHQSYYDRQCEELVQWTEQVGHFDVLDDAGRASLFRLAANTDPKLRSLARVSITHEGISGYDDKEGADAVLKVFAAERKAADCKLFAAHAASIDVEKTETTGRVTALMKKHPLADCRGEFVAQIMKNTKSMTEPVKVGFELAESEPSLKVRSAILKAIGKRAAKPNFFYPKPMYESYATATCKALAASTTAGGDIGKIATEYSKKIKACKSEDTITGAAPSGSVPSAPAVPAPSSSS